jgi:hypothetical protein
MRLFVPLTKAEFDALRELALNERRRPQDQAAVILAQSLRSSQHPAASNSDKPTEFVMSRKHEEAERASA